MKCATKWFIVNNTQLTYLDIHWVLLSWLTEQTFHFDRIRFFKETCRDKKFETWQRCIIFVSFELTAQEAVYIL